MLIFSTAQILLVFNYTGEYSRAEERVFFRLFMDDEGVDPSDYDYASTTNFYYTLSELRDHIQESVDTYFELEEIDTIEKYGYTYYEDDVTEEEVITRPVLSTYFIRGEGRNEYPDLNFNLTSEDIGPCGSEDTELRYFLSNLTHFKIIYQVKSFIPSESITPFDCFRWEIIQNYDFSERNHIYERITYNRYYCTGMLDF